MNAKIKKRAFFAFGAIALTAMLIDIAVNEPRGYNAPPTKEQKKANAALIAFLDNVKEKQKQIK